MTEVELLEQIDDRGFEELDKEIQKITGDDTLTSRDYFFSLVKTEETTEGDLHYLELTPMPGLNEDKDLKPLQIRALTKAKVVFDEEEIKRVVRSASSSNTLIWE